MAFSAGFTVLVQLVRLARPILSSQPECRTFCARSGRNFSQRTPRWMGTMALNRKKTWLAACLSVILTAAPAWSQGLEDAQLFAPAEVDQFGGGPRPNEGFFISVDYLRWTIQAPETTTIGYQGLTREVYYDSGYTDPISGIVVGPTVGIQGNSLNTGFLTAEWTDGQRIEFGDVAGHHGWLFSGMRLHHQDQQGNFSRADMVFQDLETLPNARHLYGWVPHATYDEDGDFIYTNFQLHDLPLTFDTVEVRNRVDLWGVEWMYLYRLHPNHHGGIFEFYLGARYLEFNEQFDVDARGRRFEYDVDDNVVGARCILADSDWMTKADNHIVGPQIGARYFKTTGRWTFSSEGRFLAGFNSQNIRQRGTLGSRLRDAWGVDDGVESDPELLSGAPGFPYEPDAMRPISFNYVEHESEWSPAVEVRLQAKYQITRAISARFGWDFFWIDGIARPSNMIDYTLADSKVFGINKAHNRQDVLMHGWHIGLELNR
jgi:hypothetical protein